jgi:hypothetical protein
VVDGLPAHVTTCRTSDDGRPDGNLIDADTQWRKLEVLVRAAERLWG